MDIITLIIITLTAWGLLGAAAFYKFAPDEPKGLVKPALWLILSGPATWLALIWATGEVIIPAIWSIAVAVFKVARIIAILFFKWLMAPLAMGAVLLIGGPGDWLADKWTKLKEEKNNERG